MSIAELLFVQPDKGHLLTSFFVSTFCLINFYAQDMGSAAPMEDSGHVLKSAALNDAPSSTQVEEGDEISYTVEPYPSSNEHECPQDRAEVESSDITKAKASSSARSFKNIVFELLNGAVISSSICGVKDPMWYAARNVSRPPLWFFFRNRANLPEEFWPRCSRHSREYLTGSPGIFPSSPDIWR